MLFCSLALFAYSISLMLCGQFDILCCSIKNLEFARLIDNGTTTDELRDTLFEYKLTLERPFDQFKYGNEMLDEPISRDILKR